jgi:iron complex outermembrane receptor protein
VTGDGEDLRELNYRQRDAIFRGAETKLTRPLLDNAEDGMLDGELFADYVRATLDGGGGNVPRIPPWHVGAGLHWSREKYYGGASVKYSAPQNQTAPFETRTAGFTSVDAYVGWQSMGPGARLDVSLIGHNLTDSTQHNAVSINKDAVTLPGQDVRLVVRLML